MGFGAGFSFAGEVCGSFSAGVIAIGLDVLSTAYKEGRDTVLMRAKIQEATRTFIYASRKRFGSVRCCDIVGHDNIFDPEGFREVLFKDGFGHCFAIQRWVSLFPLPSEQPSKKTISLDSENRVELSEEEAEKEFRQWDKYLEERIDQKKKQMD